MKGFVNLFAFVLVGIALSACSDPKLNDEQKKLAGSGIKFAEDAAKVLENAESADDAETKLNGLLTGDAKAGFEFVEKHREELIYQEWLGETNPFRSDAASVALKAAATANPSAFGGPISKRIWAMFSTLDMKAPWEAPAPE